MDILVKMLKVELPFLLTIASGLCLTRSGEPFNTALFTIHKLIALASIVYMAIVIRNLLKVNAGNRLVWILIFVAVCSVLLLFVSCGFLSLKKSAYHLMLTMHGLVPIVTVAIVSAIVYLLAR